jgi:5-methylcytosine-specific restriction enzyme A
MHKYKFMVDRQYARKDVYHEIGVPEDTHGGSWDTGYNKYHDDYFIFTNIGIPGRTGHDYGDRFEGDTLVWKAKGGTRLGQPQMMELLDPPGYVYIFYRTNNQDPFTYVGTGVPISHKDTSPVEVVWKLLGDYSEQELSNRELKEISEGGQRTVTSTTYERNPLARRLCVSHYGYKCAVCGFDFGEVYGDLGSGYIHVHHVVPISTIGKEYIVDPIKDLRPVCANCHAMIHRRKPALPLGEVVETLNRQ